MKILQVTQSFKPMWRYGGVVRVAYEISKQLQERGHEVTVYTTNRSFSKSIVNNKPTNVEGITVYYFKNIGKYFPSGILAVAPYYLPFIARKQIKNFDIIHVHEYRTLLSLIVHRYAKKYNIPYVVQTHGELPLSIGKKRLKNIYDLIWGNKILKDASKVIALNKTEAENFKNKGITEDKIEIVPNGIDLSEYRNLPKRGMFRKKYSIKENEKIILYLGRIHKSKGVDLLVEAFALVKNELENVKLIFVGPDGGYQSTLEELAKDLKINDKILFTGLVTTNEKISAYVDADVFVTPQFSGFPITFLEACACSTPIITTNRGDELDWIDGKVGYVVKFDKYKLSNAIFKILSDEKLHNRMSKEGKRLVNEEFFWGNIVNKIGNLYESVCEEA